jgi:hypothetical protein
MWEHRLTIAGTAIGCVAVIAFMYAGGYMSHTEEPTATERESAPAQIAIQEIVTATSSGNISISSRQHVDTYKQATATVFWVGENADDSNGYIPNDASAWDSQWQTHFGGLDDPENRCGYVPCAFTPQENPFYFALPYNDLDASGSIRSNAAAVIPWWSTSSTEQSQLKNRWVEIAYGSRVCYGQWQDVGPYEENDARYVFGTSTPKNTFGLKAGLDVSPALNDCLHLQGAGVVQWRFVDWKRVPPGPWKDIVTTRTVSWY